MKGRIREKGHWETFQAQREINGEGKGDEGKKGKRMKGK